MSTDSDGVLFWILDLITIVEFYVIDVIYYCCCSNKRVLLIFAIFSMSVYLVVVVMAIAFCLFHLYLFFYFNADTSNLSPSTFDISDTLVTYRYNLHPFNFLNVNADEIIFVISSMIALSL